MRNEKALAVNGAVLLKHFTAQPAYEASFSSPWLCFLRALRTS